MFAIEFDGAELVPNFPNLLFIASGLDSIGLYGKYFYMQDLSLCKKMLST